MYLQLLPLKDYNQSEVDGNTIVKMVKLTCGPRKTSEPKDIRLGRGTQSVSLELLSVAIIAASTKVVHA